MRRTLISLVLVVSLLHFLEWPVTSVSPTDFPIGIKSSPTPLQADEHRLTLDELYTKTDNLKYREFELRKLRKKIRPDAGESIVEVSYAALQRRGKTIALFDGVYSGVGNATEFGLVSFTGKDERQFLISQTIPRGGRHWIVSVFPTYRVLFDSADFGVGREEVEIVDVDEDGSYEVLLPLTGFYALENVALADIPLPEIIFKFDKASGRYLPANHILRDYSLKGIERDLAGLEEFQDEAKASSVLSITLKLILAGKESDGWALFNTEYTLRNRIQLKAKILRLLKSDPVYRMIYRN